MSTPDTNLYSATQPADLGDKIRRIVPQSGCTHYATASFRSDDESGAAVYLEAKEQDNKLWELLKITEKPAGLYGEDEGDIDEGDTIEETTPLKSDLCFFDALHYAASWEQSCENSDIAVMIKASDNGRAGTLPHWRDIAAAERQPIERKTGLPAPAADGHILAYGAFTRKSRDEALATKDNLADMVPKASPRTPEAPARNPDSAASRALVRVNNAAQCSQLVQKNEDRIKRLRRQGDQGLKHDFAHVARGIKETLKGVGFTAASTSGSVAAFMLSSYFSSNNAFGWEFAFFMSGTAIGIATLIAGGVTVAIAAEEAKHGNMTLPRRAFNREMKKYRRHVAQLPDSDYKDQMRYAGDEMELLYYKEATTCSFNKAADGGFLAQRRFHKDLGTLTKIMAAQNISDNRQAAILEKIESGNEANEYKWEHEIKTLIGPAKETLHTMDKQDIPALLAPAARAPKALPAPGHSKHGGPAP